MSTFEITSRCNYKRVISVLSEKFSVFKDELTAKSTDPTMVARATTYSGKVVRIVHVFSEEALAEYAEHCEKWDKTRKKNAPE